MIKRHLYHRLKEALTQFPAVALLGPRQIGKTTLAFDLSKEKEAPVHYFDLENPADLAKFQDASSFLKRYRGELVILDEIQRLPDLFTILRGLIDEARREGHKVGQFLLLGSASHELLRQSSESLAGRILYINLMGLTPLEVGIDKVNTLWLRGGFPDSFLASTDLSSFEWRDALISTYLEREISQFGLRIPHATLGRLWSMLAHNQGQVLNVARLAEAVGISSTTVNRYLDVLSDLFLIRRLEPWSKNIGKRLVRSPKIYIRDSGLCHTLLRIDSYENLLAHPVVGSSWESFVIEQISTSLPRSVPVMFYRTQAGAEIDLVIEIAYDKLIAIEVKRSVAPKLSKGLVDTLSSLKPVKTYIVNAGDDHYPLREDVNVISLPLLLTELQKLVK